MRLTDSGRPGMLAAFVAIGAVMASCSADLIAPADPEWAESCVFTVTPDKPFDTTLEEMRRCREVRFRVGNYCEAGEP